MWTNFSKLNAAIACSSLFAVQFPEFVVTWFGTESPVLWPLQCPCICASIHSHMRTYKRTLQVRRILQAAFAVFCHFVECYVHVLRDFAEFSPFGVSNLFQGLPQLHLNPSSNSACERLNLRLIFPQVCLTLCHDDL